MSNWTLRGITLRQCLSIPFDLAIQSRPGPDGAWKRHAYFPELPGCDVEGDTTVDVVAEAERKLVRWLLERIVLGEPIPVPRPALSWVDAAGLLRESGLERWLSSLDRDIADIHNEGR